MNDDAIKRHNERTEYYNAGLSAGIAFACAHFLRPLPICIFDEALEKSIKHLIDEYHSL